MWRRDGGCCAFVGTEGRCGERAFLELHHVEPMLWAARRRKRTSSCGRTTPTRRACSSGLTSCAKSAPGGLTRSWPERADRSPRESASTGLTGTKPRGPLINSNSAIRACSARMSKPWTHRGSGFMHRMPPTRKAARSARYTGAGASGRHPRPRKGLRPPRHRSSSSRMISFPARESGQRARRAVR